MSNFQVLEETRAAWALGSPGARLAAIREAGKKLRERILSSGRAEAMVTRELVTVAYPTRFALQTAALTPWPYLMITNRMNVVQFIDASGRRRTLVVNPTDYERGGEAPFYKKLAGQYGDFLSNRVLSKRFGMADQQLLGLGLRPEDVDYVTFDHLHIQDLRRWFGTSEGESARFPNARLLIERREWAAVSGGLHPLQTSWYVPGGVRGIPEDKIVIFDGDLLLGGGVALVSTLGHTDGNHTIVVNTPSGVCTISENGVGVDNYVPELSAIPGVAKHARFWEQEVVLNANTLERSCDQYTSMVLEKTLADRCPEAKEYPLHLASSEFRASPFFPGLAPTLQVKVPEFGALLRPGKS